MSQQAFDRFLRGEDRLARLLCALPAHTPSAEFEAAFARAARAAQAQRDAIRTETAPGQAAASGPATLDGTRLDAIPSAFEPPASLEASFLKMAASIESAQAPRRDAILNGIAHGDSAQAMLGAAIAPGTEEWLRAQAPAAAQTRPAPPSPPGRKRTFLGFRWFDLRLAAVACVLAVIGIQLALMHDPDPQQLAVQEVFEKAVAPRDSSNGADPARDGRGPLADAQLALAQTDTAMPQGRQDRLAAAERAAAPAPLKKSQARATAPQALPADGPKPASPSPPPPAPPAGKAAPAEAIGAPARLPAGNAARPPALASGIADEARADAPHAQPAPPATARIALQAGRPQETLAASGFPGSRKEEASARERAVGQITAQEAKQLGRATPAEQPAATPPGMARPTTLAAAPSMAAHPAPASRQQASDTGISATLADDPARIAILLPARPAGALWTVFSSQPRQPELDRWLEALRQHMPASSRPARFELIRDEGGSGAERLRIVPPPSETP